MVRKQLAAEDILSLVDYEAVRAVKKAELRGGKKNRSISVGPHITVFFENYDTMWTHIHEILRVQKIHLSQLADELAAHNSLIPNGRELIATVMLEIEEDSHHSFVFSCALGVEEKMELRFDGEIVKGRSDRGLGYTSAAGRVSSMQSVHFPFTSDQILKFVTPQQEVVIAITHANYGHMAIMLQDMRMELSKDFN